ncbi:pyridoxamine 5'-phosphate oxidase family protein [Streptacidiphilus fuscans]|uniref:Pyridoxamine 5'-phosphate oxidase family protein n=1 Tax=Streptacidiphilus fuscans TaxID=2789292 RepID=A0A931B1L1_9ACTN|nr:pyridoxamine 5'-phosphate oxidase family protein [Streptacidiphilus fuscans]MBF9067032.1 pyridoxamine 5'-phosphate oxidase family protein [Streptacidiphilus fuscans]
MFAVSPSGTTEPGRAGAERRTVKVDLTEDECWSRLGGHGVGRIVFLVGGALIVRPVDYQAADGVLRIRSDESDVLAGAVGRRVVLEVDCADDACGPGWSVRVSGHAALDRRDAVRSGSPEGEGEPEPWADGPSDLLVRIRPHRVAGQTRLASRSGTHPYGSRP